MLPSIPRRCRTDHNDWVRVTVANKNHGGMSTSFAKRINNKSSILPAVERTMHTSFRGRLTSTQHLHQETSLKSIIENSQSCRKDVPFEEERDNIAVVQGQLSMMDR